jgi:hypothetical protein
MPARAFTTCRTPGCEEPVDDGSRRFCATCRGRLAAIRAEFEAERKQRIQPKHRGGGVRCCRPGCWERRIPPAAYCASCAAAGYVEAADA